MGKMFKKDICPQCLIGGRTVYLTWQEKYRKLGCDRCGFLCRRGGSSMMDPAKDRRGQDDTSAWSSMKYIR